MSFSYKHADRRTSIYPPPDERYSPITSSICGPKNPTDNTIFVSSSTCRAQRDTSIQGTRRYPWCRELPKTRSAYQTPQIIPYMHIFKLELIGLRGIPASRVPEDIHDAEILRSLRSEYTGLKTRFGGRWFGWPTLWQTYTSVVNHEDMDSLFQFQLNGRPTQYSWTPAPSNRTKGQSKSENEFFFSDLMIYTTIYAYISTFRDSRDPGIQVTEDTHDAEIPRNPRSEYIGFLKTPHTLYAHISNCTVSKDLDIQGTRRYPCCRDPPEHRSV